MFLQNNHLVLFSDKLLERIPLNDPNANRNNEFVKSLKQ
jgi:hypothetical protein